MEQKVFVVDGRQFRTESDYACAMRDKEIIDKLRKETDSGDRTQLEELRKSLRSRKYHFRTLLGQDFLDEVEMQLKKLPVTVGRDKKTGWIRNRKQTSQHGQDRNTAKKSRIERSEGGKAAKESRTARPVRTEKDEQELNKIVQDELGKREKRRRLTILLCSVGALCCLGYFAVYSYYDYRTRSAYERMNTLKDKSSMGTTPSASGVQENTGEPLFTLDGGAEAKEVLEEYRNLCIRYKKLIGWVKIDNTQIDYPVMQTTDNEYYLDHNMEQKYDKNGTIFMDKDCDVLKPSTNYILYGHHMKNGKMFGGLDLYKDKSYYDEHPYISFDTIYEKGTWQIMYVFRSKVYKEDEIVFKYYQFIDANGEMEFDSYMQEMAEMSLYDTGVTARYGDQLLTLSTCDYQETDGRFVVVAKKIPGE